MADLDDLAEFARQRVLNLTGPLTHEQVVDLAEFWFPEIRFHESERFHPVDLPALFTVPVEVFNSRPEAQRDPLRISVPTLVDPQGQPIFERFDPPVVHASAGGVRRAVLGSGAAAIDGVDELNALGRSGVYTHGATVDLSRVYFGASVTVSGAGEPTPGDPRLPRHLPMVVRAELRMLLEALKHELELDQLPEPLRGRGQPIDAIWSGFAVEDSFFRESAIVDIREPSAEARGRRVPFTRDEKRAILRDLVAAHEANDRDAEQAALDRIPEGWTLVTAAWNVVREFAFLEYYMMFPFNDYKEYGTAPFDNEHEGDVEGCCVVFTRNALIAYAQGVLSVDQVVPHSLITNAHEEFQELDQLLRLPAVGARARDELKAYVARGSHGVYLTAGDHDILDFEDVVIDLPQHLPTPLLIIGLLSGVLPTVAIVAGIIEHFVDAEDQTSDNGASISDEPADPGALRFEKRLEVTPLSHIVDDVNIYQDVPALRALLALRGYPGNWGGDAGNVDKSSPWKNKTARYFRRFVKSDNIVAGPIIE